MVLAMLAVPCFDAGALSLPRSAVDASGIMTLLGLVGEILVVPDGTAEIAPEQYKDRDDISTVILPASVRRIGDRAFAGCMGLTTVTVAGELDGIGESAFDTCTMLHDVIFAQKVKNVGGYAFRNCTSLATVEFKEGLESIGPYAFQECERLTSVILPNSFELASDTVFDGCSALKAVTVSTHGKTLKELFPQRYDAIENAYVPSGATDIVAGMFEGCSSLVEVVFMEAEGDAEHSGGGVRQIGDSAFARCRQLPLIRLPVSLQTIGANAFEGCESLFSVIVPSNVVTMGSAVFSGCRKLEYVTLSPALTSIEDNAFNLCSELNTLTVPASVRSIGSRIVGSSGVKALKFEGDAPSYSPTALKDSPNSDGDSLTVFVMEGTRGWDDIPRSAYLPDYWPKSVPDKRPTRRYNQTPFDVTFDANGGEFENDGSESFARSQLTGEMLSVPFYNPVREGYRFKGWYRQRDGGSQETPATLVQDAAPYTLYAHWESGRPVVISFSAEGGTVVPDRLTRTSGDMYGALPVPTKKYFAFNGWWTARGGDGKRVEASTKVPEASVQLYARWDESSYTIRFHAENGTGDTVDQGFIYGRTVALKWNEFSYDGYTFGGWATKSGGKAVYEDGEEIPDIGNIQDKVIDLYATWVADRYSVRFSANGGVGRMDNQTFTLGIGQKLSKCLFVRTDYEFSGWSRSVNGPAEWADEEMFVDMGAKKGETVELYAIWIEPIPRHPVTFQAMGGECAESVRNVAEGSSVGELPLPVREHWTFDGWFTGQYGGTAVSADYLVTNAVTLYAHWTERPKHAVKVGNASYEFHEGTAVTFSAPPDVTDGGTNIVCTGWTGTGDAPASGSGGKVSFTVTQPSEVSWRIATNYWLKAGHGDIGTVHASTLAGDVDKSGCWLASGTEVALSADSPVYSHFVEWRLEGESRAFETSPSFTLTMTGAFSLVAVFEADKIVVDFGGGDFREFEYGERVSFSTFGSRTEGLTNLVCTGWAGTGDAPSSGSANEVSFTVTQPSTLTWLYRTNYWFEVVDAAGGGCVVASRDPGVGLDGYWLPAGTAVSLDVELTHPWILTGWANRAGEPDVFPEDVRDFVLDKPLVLEPLASKSRFVRFEPDGRGLDRQHVVEVAYGEDAEAPDVSPVPGYAFAGWDVDIRNVVSNMAVHALYEPISYPIEYVDTKGCDNGNPSAYTIEDSVVFDALRDVPGWIFMGWDPASIPSGETGKKAVTARWHQLKYSLALDGAVRNDLVYGQELTLSAPETIVNDTTNLVCTGWTGTGDVPATGTGAQVSITVTQSSTIDWQYDGEYLLSVESSAGGSACLQGGEAMPGSWTQWCGKGADVELVGVPDAGYSFVGWKDGASGVNLGSELHLTVPMVQARSILAEFFAHVYSVRFHVDAEDVHTEVQGFKYGTPAPLSPAKLRKPGYTLVGWTRTPGAQDLDYGSGEIVLNLAESDGAEVDLYGVWTPNHYTVRFDKGGDDVQGEMDDMEFVYGEPQNLASNRFVREGFGFVGWDYYYKTESWGYQRRVDDGQSVEDLTDQPDDVVVLTARWARRHVIAFDKNGGEGGTDSVSVLDTAESLPDVEIPSRPGYVFDGYMLGEAMIYQLDGKSCQPGYNVYSGTARAVWRKDERWYWISYDLGEGGWNADENPWRYYVWDEEIRLADPIPYDGYRFAGWLPTNAIPQFSEGDKTFTAVWTKRKVCKVTYDLGRDGAYRTYAVYPLNRLTVGECYEGDVLDELLEPSLDGYSFGGWFSTPDGDGRFSNGFEVVDDVVLYARWIPNTYVVRYNGGGASGSMPDRTFVYGEERALDALAYVMPGLTFLGWRIEDMGFLPYLNDGQVVSNLTSQADAVVELVAQWSASSYRLRLHDNGAYSASLYDKSLGFLTPLDGVWELECPADRQMPTVSGCYSREAQYAYTFAGWSLAPDGPAVVAADSSVLDMVLATGGAAELYAVWEPIRYTLRFEGNGGSGSMEQMEMAYGEEYELPPCAFTLEGKELDSWALYVYDFEYPSGFYADGATVSNVVTALTTSYGVGNPDGTVTWHGDVPCNPRLVARWRNKRFSVMEDGVERGRYEIGQTVVLRSRADEYVDEWTRVSCVGWIDGTGDIAPSGVVDRVSFNVTQPSSLTWVYATNHMVQTSSDSEPGPGQDAFFNFAYLDEFSGNGCYTMQSYVRQGYSVTVVAEPAENYCFDGWFDGNTGLPVEPVEGVEFKADDKARIYRLVVRDVERPLNFKARFSMRRCTATFDLLGHAVRTGGGELEQEVGYGKKAVAPKLSVDAAYKFIGWSHPLEAVYEDVTYVAQYEKVATRVDAGLVAGSEGLGSVSGGKAAKTGMSVTLKATAAKNCVFSGWFVDVDGTIPFAGAADHRAASCPVVTTGDDVMLYAKFIKLEDDWVALDLPTEVTNVTKVAATPINVGTEASSLPTVKVTGLPAGLKFTAKDVLKKGSKTEVEIPANTIYGTPSKSGIYVASVTATTAGKKSVTKTVKFIVRAPGEALVDVSWDASLGKVTGLGVCAVGKSLTLKATANKNYVFAGWYLDAGFTVPAEGSVDYRNASFAVAGGGADKVLYARFAPSDDDTALAANVDDRYELNGEWSMKVDISSLSLPAVSVKGLPAGLKFDAKSFVISGVPTAPGSYKVVLSLKNSTVKTAVSQSFVIDVANIESPYLEGVDYAEDAYVYRGGVSVLWDIGSCARQGYAVSAVKGLPAGLKFSAKTGLVEGVPTKAGSYTVTITLKNGRQTSVATVTMTVEGFEQWAFGSFDGGSVSGRVQLSVASSGKISGKLQEGGVVYSMSADSYSAYVDGTYLADVTASWSFKDGKTTVKTNETWTVAVSRGDVGGVVASGRFDAWQNLWSQKEWKDRGALLFGRQGMEMALPGDVYGLADGESVSLVVKPNGTVSAKGLFDTGTVDRNGRPVYLSTAVSSVVCKKSADPFVGLVFLDFPPNPSKGFEGCTLVVEVADR